MKKGNWNIIIFYWLLNDVFKYPLNKRLNLPFKILRLILMPIETTYYLMRDSVDCFDLASGVFTIYGMKYSHVYFKALSNRGQKLNSIFQVVKKEDGVLTIKDVTSSYIRTDQIPYTKEEAYAFDEARAKSSFDCPVINTPEKFAPTLAEITKQGELGKEGWWEVVYHDGANWQHFAGSDTFDDGEKVVKWKLCRECL